MAIYNDTESKYQNIIALLNEKLTDELGPVRESLDGLSAETKSFLEKVNTTLHEQEEEIKALKLAANRPVLGGASDQSAEAVKSREAMNKALRVGWGKLSNEERKYVRLEAEAGIEHKALYAADGTTGGFLAVPEFVNDLIKAIVLVSPMLSVVDVRQTSQPFIMIPKRTQTSTAVRVAEQATRTETQNPKFGLVQVFPFESYALTLISRTDLDDAEIDLAQFIMDDQSVQFAKLAGNEMINGTGSGAGQCLGFLNDTAITGTAITSSTAGTFKVNDFTTLMHSIKTGYRPGSVWLMQTQTLGNIRGLTDTTGRPLWMPFGADTATGQIYGYNVIEAPDMPAQAAGNYAIAYGNFKTGYQAVVRKQMTIITLNERYADQNAIGYMGYYRFGGTTKLSEAINLMQIHS